MGIAFAPGQIEHVANDHVFICVVCAHPIGWMNGFIIKTLQIDGVRAVDGDLPIVDIPCDGTDQPEILVFVISSKGSGENNQWQPMLLAENEHLKLAAE